MTEDLPIQCFSFCRYIDAQTLSQFSQRILSDLVPFLAQATENSLALIMETIRAVIGVDASILNAGATSQLVNVIFQVWQSHPEGNEKTQCKKNHMLMGLPSCIARSHRYSHHGGVVRNHGWIRV